VTPESVLTHQLSGEEIYAAVSAHKQTYRKNKATKKLQRRNP